MNNQLSKLTYLPKACEAMRKRRTKLQKLTRRSESLDFFCALTLIDVASVYGEQCSYAPAARATSTCAPLHLLEHFYTQTKETRAETGMTCTRLNEGGPGVWRIPQTLSSPPHRWTLWRPLSPPRPLTAEVWISFQIRVRAQQKVLFLST